MLNYMAYYSNYMWNKYSKPYSKITVISVRRFMLTQVLGSSKVGVVHILWTMEGYGSERDLQWGSANA
jgi:hypothetical protein